MRAEINERLLCADTSEAGLFDAPPPVVVVDAVG